MSYWLPLVAKETKKCSSLAGFFYMRELNQGFVSKEYERIDIETLISNLCHSPTGKVLQKGVNVIHLFGNLTKR